MSAAPGRLLGTDVRCVHVVGIAGAGLSGVSTASLAARRSPRISMVNSVPPSIISTGTKPSATLFPL